MLSVQDLLLYVDIKDVLIFTVLLYLLSKQFFNWNLPPGPWGLPIVGYLPFVDRNNFHDQLIKIGKKYQSNVISVQMGSQTTIFLNDYEAIKEAFVKQQAIFNGRPEDMVFKVDGKYNSVVNEENASWTQHRKLMTRTLRDYGMGKTSIEPKIQNEIAHFLNAIQDHEGQAFDPLKLISMSTANLIATMTFGKRYEYSDENFQYVRHLYDEIPQFLGTLALSAFFPMLKKLPIIRNLVNPSQLIRIREKLEVFNRQRMEEHEQAYVLESRTDYIDAFLTQKNEEIKQHKSEGFFTMNFLEANLTALFGAGAGTITSSLGWAILYMMANPKIQERVYREIEEVVGMNRYPAVADKPNMPYVEATLMEIQRFASVVSLNLIHSNTEETHLFGYRIPKRSYVIANLWAVHRSEDYWDEPDLFKPERFIDDEGRVKKSDYLIPFSIGKRSCLGESLAKIENFLYFSAMIQRFEFKPEKDSVVSLDHVNSITRDPKPFKTCAIQRQTYNVVQD